MRVTQKSFAGGEISPMLYGRNDIQKYPIGLKKLKNGFVHQEGTVSNRSGTQLCGEVKNSNEKTRLIPFSFNTEQTYVIEAGNKYFRFIKDGGYIIYPDNYSQTNKRGQIVEIASPFSSDELPLLKYSQNADVLAICHNNHTPVELSRNSHYDWNVKNIDFKPKIQAPVNVKASWDGSSENKRTYSYVVTAVSDKDEESNKSEVVTVDGRYEGYWTVNERMTISWDKVENAVEYNIYRSVNGVFGYIGTATDNSFVDDKIEPDLTSTAPIEKNPFEDNNFPAVVNYFQQRKVYGCLKNNPQQIIASQLAASDNFNVSRPLSASDAISLTIAEREVNEIRHIIAMNDLILLTSGGEWKLNGSDGSFSATSSLIALPQSYYGSSHVAPVVSGNMILFVQAGGSVIRDLGYTYVSDSYDGDELTIFANHLFQDKQVIDMAYSKEPYRILWCVMSDGTVNALTYNRKQDMVAWSQHITDGKFESVACIRENNEDIAYFIVQRNINGQIKRFVERMSTRIINKSSDSVFLDCSLKYIGVPVDELSGLEHLEGKKVYVNADGGFEEHFVKNGKIKLDNNASVISVGLPYEFELETLNIEGETTHGLIKIINRISVKIDKSREDFLFINPDGSAVRNPRHIDSVNNSDLLISSDIDYTPFSVYQEETTIHIKQDLPLPLTILSVSAEVQLQDTN